MSYMMAIGPCINCGRTFTFNPDLVPSIRVKGKREPVCKTCVEMANPLRKARGLEEIKIQPGAYEAQEVPY